MRHVNVFKLTMVVLQVLESTVVVAENASLDIIKLEEVKKAWCKSYKYPGDKYFALEGLFDSLSVFPTEVNKAELKAAQEYLLTEVLNVPVATVQDCDPDLSVRVHWMGEYLRKISSWQSLRFDTNQLMRIADKVSQYHVLFDLSKTDALIMAHKVDRYVEHGTNTPPRRCGIVVGMSTWKPWFGPTGSRVAKIIDFRRSYNKSVEDLRRSTLQGFHWLITQRRWDDARPSNPEAERSLWLEFSRRANATSSEIAVGEGR